MGTGNSKNNDDDKKKLEREQRTRERRRMEREISEDIKKDNMKTLKSNFDIELEENKENIDKYDRIFAYNQSCLKYFNKLYDSENERYKDNKETIKCLTKIKDLWHLRFEVENRLDIKIAENRQDFLNNIKNEETIPKICVEYTTYFFETLFDDIDNASYDSDSGKKKKKGSRRRKLKTPKKRKSKTPKRRKSKRKN